MMASLVRDAGVALALGLLVVSSAIGAGCGGAQSAPRDSAQESIASTQQRLRGTWTLINFTPDVPLEQSLQAFLQMQFGRMKITIDGENLTAQGAGIQATRRIVVRSGYGNHFDAAIFDAQGVGYETSNDFQDDRVLAQIITLPWRGKAVFQRSSK
jgi:hypothetical protein